MIITVFRKLSYPISVSRRLNIFVLTGYNIEAKSFFMFCQLLEVEQSVLKDYGKSKKGSEVDSLYFSRTWKEEEFVLVMEELRDRTFASKIK